ncbi:MAG: helix-turn-helix domain-containing protein [Oscillospiraceae bacterium]
MKQSKLCFGGNLFSKVFSIVIIITVIITVINLLGSSYIKNAILKGGMREQKAYIDAYSATMDDAFRSVDNMIAHIEGSNSVKRIANPQYRYTTDYLKNNQDIFATFSTLANTSEGVVDIFLLPKHGQLCYTSTGHTYAKTYFDNRYNGDYKEWMSLLQDAGHKAEIQTIPFSEKSEKGSLYAQNSRIYSMKSIRVNRSVIGTLVISIDNQLVDRVFSNQEFAQNRMIYVLNDKDEVISANTKRSPEQWILQCEQSNQAETSGIYKKGEGLISTRVSNQNGIRYLIFTPYSVVMGGYDKIIFTLNFLYIFVMALLIFYGYVLSKKMYRPFRSIVDALQDINTCKQKNALKNETEFIKSRVLDIVSVNYSLMNTVQDSSPMILETVLFKTIKGSPTLDQALAVTDPYNIVFQIGFYNVFVIRMDLQSYSDEQFASKYYQKFTALLHAHLERWILSTLETQVDEFAIVTYYHDDTDNPAILTGFSNVVRDLIAEIPDSQFFIGYGNWVSDILQIKTCYEQALSAIRIRPVDETNILLHYQNDTPKATTFFIPFDMEIELSTMFSDGHFEVAEKYLMEILDRNLKSKITFEDYLVMCYTINGFLLRYIRNKSVSAYQDTIHINPNTYIYSAERLNEILFSNLAVLRQFFTSPSPETATVVERVIEYLNIHYADDINLALLACDLGYTPNYISRLFKQAKGLNFTDYLNRKRVDHAKKALKTTSKTIKQIAQISGFNSTTLFIRTFERYEGFTPGEFRKIKN